MGMKMDGFEKEDSKRWTQITLRRMSYGGFERQDCGDGLVL